MKIAYIIGLWGKYYGHYLFERLISNYPNIDLDIYYCSYSEANRHYKIILAQSDYYQSFYLKGEISWGIDKHFNLGIIPLIFKNNYDFYLIGGYSYPTVALAIILSRLLKRKYILLIDHMYKKEGKEEWLKNLIKRFLIKGANAYITTSEEAKENLVFYGAYKDKIFIAPLSCPDFFYRENIKINNNFVKPFEKYILFIGRFEEYKGVMYLLEAFKILRNKYQYQDIGLFLIGSGSLKQRIRDWVVNNQLENWIKIENWKPYEELPQWYFNALMFVCPSFYEPWAFVVNEAMAAGLPIIATQAVGAARALIKNEENGFVIKEKDGEQLALKMKELLENEELRKKLSENAYKTQKKYTLDKISDIYYQVFQIVLNNK
jgi:glycosyltransferase involved in cell wall biosynthesis